MQPFSSNNQINAAGYSYDAAGDLTTDALGNTYAYNAEGMLTSTNSAQYTYDALDQRVEKTGGSYPTETIYFQGKPIALLNATSGAWTDLIWAGGGLIAEVAGTQTALPSYRLLDHEGSLAMTTDGSGNVTGTNVLSPYGEVLSSNTSDSFSYAGLTQDTEYGGHAATFRNYSAEQLRWTRPDPYNGSYDPANPQSMNRYVYAMNNPLALTDPSGLDCVYTEDGQTVTTLTGDCRSTTDDGYYVDCDGCLMNATWGQTDQNGNLTFYDGANPDPLGVINGFTDPYVASTTVYVSSDNVMATIDFLLSGFQGVVRGNTSTGTIRAPNNPSVGPKTPPTPPKQSYLGFLACETAFDFYASFPEAPALSVSNGAAILSITAKKFPKVLGEIGLLYAAAVEIPTAAAANQSCSASNGY